MRQRSFLILLAFLTACTRPAIKSPEQAMRPVEKMPDLNDDLDLSLLAKALAKDIKALRGHKGQMLAFGTEKILAEDYARALEQLQHEAEQDTSGARFRTALGTNFRAFEVYGQDRWGEILLTAYFEPVINGTLKKKSPYTEPIYGVPKDLVEIDVGSFAAARPQLAIDGKIEQRSATNILRGRLLASRDPATPARVVAFPDRAGITAGDLKNDVVPMAYADPIDVFFLEIQGSGVVHLGEGGDLTVGYASQNGYPYVPIGKFLLDKIPKDKMSQQAIEAHLRSLTTDQARELLNKNPSYVFFHPLKTSGVSFLGTEVVPGRTIATDQVYFPKGALAFLQFEKPNFADSKAVEPTAFVKTSRFVLDQDTGGAIRGPGRVDLFWGRGSDAKQAAGVMRGKARLMYFLPKQEWLNTIRSEARQ